MTDLTIKPSDIGVSHEFLYGIENVLFTKTTTNIIRVCEEHSTSSKVMYAFNPVINTIVEIDPHQAWFWKPEWLKDELTAEKELRSGDYKEFDSIDDFIDSL